MNSWAFMPCEASEGSVDFADFGRESCGQLTGSWDFPAHGSGLAPLC